MLMISVLLCLGLLAGLVAVTVGGGATIGVPLLLFMGQSAAVAIATVKFALVGSFVTGSLVHRRISTPGTRIPWIIWPLSVAGSVVGSLLVVGIDDRILRIIVCVLMIVVLRITHRTDFSPFARATAARQLPLAGVAAIFGLCVYSGFFGAGFGTFLIFALMRFYGLSYPESATVMTNINLLVVGSSVATFITKSMVDFHAGLPLLVGCAFGGVFGAWIAKIVNPKHMKAAFMSFTLLLTVKLLWDVAKST